jgi:hypothetical protein
MKTGRSKRGKETTYPIITMIVLMVAFGLTGLRTLLADILAPFLKKTIRIRNTRLQMNF